MRLDNIKYESKKLTIKRYLDGEIWRGSYCVTAVWFFFFSLSSLSSYLKKKVDDLCKRRVFRHLRAFWLRPSYQRGETALGIRSPLLTPPPPPPAAAKLSFIIVTIPKVVRKGKHLEAVWRASKEKKKNRDKRWRRPEGAQEPNRTVFWLRGKDRTDAVVGMESSPYVVVFILSV